MGARQVVDVALGLGEAAPVDSACRRLKVEEGALVPCRVIWQQAGKRRESKVRGGIIATEHVGIIEHTHTKLPHYYAPTPPPPTRTYLPASGW